MVRPGIRHLNRGFNTVGRPTAPVNDRGSGVQEIPANLATQQQRTEILATGRKGETSNIRTAGLAAGTVLTQTAQNQFRSLTDAAYKSVVQQVPLVDIPSLDIPGINQPIIDNPVQFVGGFLQTSQYSPELVQEARVRAEKGDIVSGLYAGTADTLVKGVDDLYQRVQGPGYTTTSKALAGVLKSGANLIASVPAALQTVNFLNNPNKMAYTGILPKNVSGVEVVGGGKPAISDSVTVSIDSVEQANSVLGELTTSGVELAQKELPKAVDAVVTEFQQNPYGLAGQVLGGALLTKGVGSVLPKKVTPSRIKVEGSPATSSRITGGGRPRSIGGGNVVKSDTRIKQAVTLGGGAAGAAKVLSESRVMGETMPQTVSTVRYTSNNDFIDDILDEYPTVDRPNTAEDSSNKNKTPGITNPGQGYGGTLVIRPVEQGNTLRVEGGWSFAPELAPRIEYVKVSELTGGENANQTRNPNKTGEEYGESNSTGNRVRSEYAYDYPTPTSVRTGRGKRRINLDIDIPRRPAKARKPKRRKKYAKRQIVNPIPWLWDEEPEFTADFPEKVELVSAAELLS